MTKLVFHILNIIFIIFYLFPGSISGFLIYKNLQKQPQILPDFIFSSNHVIALALLSFFGFVVYSNIYKKLIIYFLFISIIFEFFHMFIPNRSFQFADLFGNIIGVFIAIGLFYIFKKKL